MLQYINLRSELYYAVAAMRDNGERGQLLMAILQFANGKEPDKLPATVEPIFAMVRAQMERDSAAYESKVNALRQNGRKGGRPKNQMVSDETKQNQMVSDETKQNIKEKKRKEKEHEEKATEVFGSTWGSGLLPEEETPELKAEHEWVFSVIEKFKLVDSDRTKEILLEDSEKYGHEAVENALRKANDSTNRGNISLTYYRAIINNTSGGDTHGRKSSGSWDIPL